MFLFVVSDSEGAAASPDLVWDWDINHGTDDA